MSTTYTITMTSDNPHVGHLARQAAEKIATELDWSNQYAGEVDLWAEDPTFTSRPIAAWIFEPGEDEPAPPIADDHPVVKVIGPDGETVPFAEARA